MRMVTGEWRLAGRPTVLIQRRLWCKSLHEQRTENSHSEVKSAGRRGRVHYRLVRHLHVAVITSNCVDATTDACLIDAFDLGAIAHEQLRRE